MQVETNPEYFKWDSFNCKLTFVFASDNTTYAMYFEDNNVKVGKLKEDGEPEEILSLKMKVRNMKLKDLLM